MLLQAFGYQSAAFNEWWKLVQIKEQKYTKPVEKNKLQQEAFKGHAHRFWQLKESMG